MIKTISTSIYDPIKTLRSLLRIATRTKWLDVVGAVTAALINWNDVVLVEVFSTNATSNAPTAKLNKKQKPMMFRMTAFGLGSFKPLISDSVLPLRDFSFLSLFRRKGVVHG